MATIKYQLQSKKENAPIYLRLSINRNLVLRRKTGLFINFNDWSETTSLPKQTSASNKNISSDLQKLTPIVMDRLNDASSDGTTINGDWLQHVIDVHFKRKNENAQSELLTDAIQELIDNAQTRKNGKGGIGLSKSRINSYKSLKRIILEYENNKPIKVKDVNLKFSKDFIKYMLNVKGYQKSYALKKLADIKTVCYDAETNGIEISPQLKKIESSKVSNENVIYLSTQEIKQIEDAEIENEALNNVRKWLLLGCSIGQRGGDLLKLNESNFVTRNGLSVIELRQQKTGKNVTIPVLEKTRQILEDGLPYKISIQRFNKYVKDVCEAAKINELIQGSKIEVTEKGKGNTQKRKIDGIYPKFELIGSHVCRRSFATNLYGILPTALIMQITAHSTEKMLLNYIGKDSLDYAQQIADFYTLQAQKEKRESNLTVVKDAAVNE